MNKYILIALLGLLLPACQEEEKRLDEDVFEIRNIGELSTTEYTIGKIVKLDDTGDDWHQYLGDRKILISCKAKVKAGVNLYDIKEGDIKVKGRNIEIKLPPAKITSFTIDPKQIHTEMEGVSGFRDKFTQQEKNEFMKQGEKAIRKDLESTELLKDAEKNAISFIENFYKQMGYEEVSVIPSDNK